MSAQSRHEVLAPAREAAAPTPRARSASCSRSPRRDCWPRSRAGCRGSCRPDHLTVLALVAAVAFAVSAAFGPFLGGGRVARRALARGFARRDAGPGPARRAAALRLLPRSPRRRGGDGAGGARARAVGADAPVRRTRAGDRLPGAVDQLVPGDAGAGSVLARLRAARADRGAAGADRVARGGGAGRFGVDRGADAARSRRSGWRRGDGGRVDSGARRRTCACWPNGSLTRRRSSGRRAGRPARTPAACG